MNKARIQPDKCTPGPGTYKPLKPIGFNAKKFTFKPKLNYGDPALISLKKNEPGPGAFEDKT